MWQTKTLIRPQLIISSSPLQFQRAKDFYSTTMMILRTVPALTNGAGVQLWSVLQMLVLLLAVPPVFWHVSLISLPLFERFTPDPEECSYAIGTVSSELLCRFDSWSSRASSAPVSRSRFDVATGHIVSGTVTERTNSFSAFHRVPTFVISHILTRLATKCSPIAVRQRKSTFQLSQIRLKIIQRTRLDAKQSPHLGQQSNRETKLAEIVLFVVIGTSTDQDTIEK